MTKTEIRALIKERCKQNKATLTAQSNDICQKLLTAPQFVEAQEIYAYMALPDEVDLTQVIKTALQQGKKVAVPKIISQKQGLMEFFYLDPQKSLMQQTSDGAYGISEPDMSMPAVPDATKKTLVLVPGRAFTKQGDRLGRGKGYYDRFLEKIVGSSQKMTRLPNITVVGVCFEFQVLPELPTDQFDVKMDIISQE